LHMTGIKMSDLLIPGVILAAVLLLQKAEAATVAAGSSTPVSPLSVNVPVQGGTHEDLGGFPDPGFIAPSMGTPTGGGCPAPVQRGEGIFTGTFEIIAPPGSVYLIRGPNGFLGEWGDIAGGVWMQMPTGHECVTTGMCATGHLRDLYTAEGKGYTIWIKAPDGTIKQFDTDTALGDGCRYVARW
jgi:hypothetical protein